MATKAKETEEVEVEKVAQGGGKPLKTVVTATGEILRLTDAEYKKLAKKK